MVIAHGSELNFVEVIWVVVLVKEEDPGVIILESQISRGCCDSRGSGQPRSHAFQNWEGG